MWRPEVRRCLLPIIPALPPPGFSGSLCTVALPLFPFQFSRQELQEASLCKFPPKESAAAPPPTSAATAAAEPKLSGYAEQRQRAEPAVDTSFSLRIPGRLGRNGRPPVWEKSEPVLFGNLLWVSFQRDRGLCLQRGFARCGPTNPPNNLRASLEDTVGSCPGHVRGRPQSSQAK